jgi:hypothetical protein
LEGANIDRISDFTNGLWKKIQSDEQEIKIANYNVKKSK